MSEFNNELANYQELAEQVRRLIEELERNNKVNSIEKLDEVESKFQCAREVVRKLETEYRQLNPAERGNYRLSLELCTTDVKKLRQDVIRSRELGDRQHLFESERSKSVQKRNELSKSQRQEILQAYDTQKRTGEKISETESNMLDSEQAGHHIMIELRSQREIIQRSRDNALSAQEALDQIRTTLQRMARHTATNKLITGLVILLLIIIIILIVYFKFIRHNRIHL